MEDIAETKDEGCGDGGFGGNCSDAGYGRRLGQRSAWRPVPSAGTSTATAIEADGSLMAAAAHSSALCPVHTTTTAGSAVKETLAAAV